MSGRATALRLVLLQFALAGLLGSTAARAEPFRFGMLLVGPHNDRGWSQAHFESAKRVEKKLLGTEMIYIDKVNPADRPGVTIPQLVDELVEKGCKLVIANSDDMKDGIAEAAVDHPDTRFVHVSGDHVLTGKAPQNLSNLMGRMEYGKMLAGVAAALTSRSGKIGYLGPLINAETRRLAAACFLGARYGWEKIRGKPGGSLEFEVNWIGFWFNIPGVTADPTQVSQNFFNSGFDVVVSGIDTTEAVVVAQQKRKEGKEAWAIPYDYEGACEGAGEVCLGVPYFNWTPGYVKLIKTAMAGSWTPEWLWLGPDWADINDRETSSVGFLPGPALGADARRGVEGFLRDLAQGQVNLFQGPLNYQDGSVFLAAGESATDQQIWYLGQLLEGMKGQSSPK